jgi:hypothetical protein
VRADTHDAMVSGSGEVRHALVDGGLSRRALALLWEVLARGRLPLSRPQRDFPPSQGGGRTTTRRVWRTMEET